MADVFDVDSFVESLTSKYKIADEDLAGFEAVKKGFLRQDEFSRRSQKLDKEHKERMDVEDTFKKQLEGVEQQLLTRKQKLDLVSKLETQYGPAEEWSDTLAASIGERHPQLMDDNSGRTNFTLEQVQTIVKDAVDGVRKEIVGVGNGAAIMMDFMADIPERWKEKYGTRFPKKDFGDFFSKSGTNDPFLAYELFEKPHAEKHQETKAKEREDEAEKRGYRSAMSKYGHVETPPSESAKTVFEMSDDRSKPVADAAGKQQPPAETSHEERRSKVGTAYAKALNAANSGTVPGATPGQ